MCSKKQLIIYDIPKKSLVSLKSGNKLTYIDFDTTQYNTRSNDVIKEEFLKKYKFFIKGYIDKEGGINCLKLLNPFLKEQDKTQNNILKRYGVLLVAFKEKLFAIPYDNSLLKYANSKKLDVDYLLFKGDISERILNHIQPKMVVIDDSVNKQKATNIIVYCTSLNIPVYSIPSNGAFVL